MTFAVIGLGCAVCGGLLWLWKLQLQMECIATPGPVDEDGIPVGVRLWQYLRRVKRTGGGGAGIYIVTRPNCVGTFRIVRFVPSSVGALKITWVLVRAGGRRAAAVRIVPHAIDVLARPSVEQRLVSPMAYLVQDDGRVVAKGRVNTAAKLAGFIEGCPGITRLMVMNALAAESSAGAGQIKRVGSVV